MKFRSCVSLALACDVSAAPPPAAPPPAAEKFLCLRDMTALPAGCLPVSSGNKTADPDAKDREILIDGFLSLSDIPATWQMPWSKRKKEEPPQCNWNGQGGNPCDAEIIRMAEIWKACCEDLQDSEEDCCVSFFLGNEKIHFGTAQFFPLLRSAGDDVVPNSFRVPKKARGNFVDGIWPGK